MNKDRLLKFVPAGAVLAVAVILGRVDQGVNDFSKVGTALGYGVVLALLALAVLEYRSKLRRKESR